MTDEERAALRERREEIRSILLQIPQDVIDLLKEEFEYNLPVTEWIGADGREKVMDAETRVQRMLYRDGARSVITFIETYRK